MPTKLPAIIKGQGFDQLALKPPTALSCKTKREAERFTNTYAISIRNIENAMANPMFKWSESFIDSVICILCGFVDNG
jgi:hypothetical protein